MKLPLLILSLAVFGLGACKHNQKLGSRNNPYQPSEIEFSDLLEKDSKNNPSKIPAWAPKDYGYHPSKTRINDLVHTALNVQFDWNKQYLIGTANLFFKPYFYPTDSLTLDAKGFLINKVAIVQNGQKKDLRYNYNDSLKLRIQLDRTYTRDETYEIFIDYVARPNELGGSTDEPDAITDSKGLYFINPDGSDPNRPRQIWTQGETEYSSCWFPTIDANNERTTQEINITTEAQYKTLSNGILVRSVNNPNGTRTDYWKMDQGHAPYLFMMAIGDFAIVKDKWRGMEVSYYVEPKYEKYAKMIFGNTPEMIEFYSQKLGVDFPWKKYAQVVVRDFVSGAMENTTATIHMEALQHDSRAHLDETYEDYIAHELFHQWFGDYVTCESWANLPLNESFATYAEVMWKEYKYGKDVADHHFNGDLESYMGESQYKREPLIRYGLKDPGDMFDRHSYSKGGCILMMLRKYLGDDAFYAGLKYYLKTHAYTPVEVDELRMAFEDVCGEDLHWFFDQWFMKAGHPELLIRYEYSNQNQQINIEVKQTQDLRYTSKFKLPMTVHIDYGGGMQKIPVVLNSLDTVFRFPSTNAPENVVLDGEMATVGAFLEDKPLEYWCQQLTHGANYRQKKIALKHLEKESNKTLAFNALQKALDDPFWAVREEALEILAPLMATASPEMIEKIKQMGLKDSKASVRATAVAYISGDGVEEEIAPSNTAAHEEFFAQTIRDSSYTVMAKSLASMYKVNPKRALEIARQNTNIENETVLKVITQILIVEKQADAKPFLIQCFNKATDAGSRISFLQEFQYLLGEEAPNDSDLILLQKAAETDPSWYVRFFAVRILTPHKSNEKVSAFLSRLKNVEKNPKLKEIYKKLF